MWSLSKEVHTMPQHIGKVGEWTEQCLNYHYLCTMHAIKCAATHAAKRSTGITTFSQIHALPSSFKTELPGKEMIAMPRVLIIKIMQRKGCHNWVRMVQTKLRWHSYRSRKDHLHVCEHHVIKMNKLLVGGLLENMHFAWHNLQMREVMQVFQTYHGDVFECFPSCKYSQIC